MKRVLCLCLLVIMAIITMPIASAKDKAPEPPVAASANDSVSQEVANPVAEPVANTLFNGDTPLADLVAEYGNVTEIRIVKTALTLTLYHEATPLKSYHIAIGEGGFADKERQSDRLTPEGEFYITEKSIQKNHYYLGSRWMELSYPNKEDADRGYATGLINRKTRDKIYTAIDRFQIPPQNTALGGGIGIHGGTGNNAETQGDFWTYGCIGLTDNEVNEIYDYVFSKTTKVTIIH